MSHGAEPRGVTTSGGVHRVHEGGDCYPTTAIGTEHAMATFSRDRGFVGGPFEG